LNLPHSPITKPRYGWWLLRLLYSLLPRPISAGLKTAITRQIK